MAVLNRKLFNRGGPVSSRGVGITSGLVPVQKFQEGGKVSRLGALSPALLDFGGRLLASKSLQGGVTGGLDILGQSLSGSAPSFAAGLQTYRAGQQTEKDDDTYWAYNTETETYDRVTDETFKPGIHTKDVPKQDDVSETSNEKRLWLETDPTPKDPPSVEDLTTMGTFQEFLKKIDKIKSDDPPSYTEETVNVFTLDKDKEFTVPNQITKFTEGNNVTFKDSNNESITGDQFIYAGGDAEENMWVYDKNLGHSNYIKTSDYDSTMHRKEAPEILKGFEYTSIDDIDGKKYAIFTNPALEGDAAVKKVEIGNADPETVKQGSVLDNTFQGLDGFEYEKYVDDDDGLVKARKIPGQLDKDDDPSKQFADKTMVKGTVTITNDDGGDQIIPASFIQTDLGDIIIDPIKGSPTYGKRVLLSEWLKTNDNPGFSIEPNIPKEMNAEELLDLKKGEFNLETEQTYIKNIFAGAESNGGIQSGNNKKIQDANQLLSMIDISTTGSYADQRNAMLRLLQTFDLDEAGIDLYNKFEAAIKGGSIPATEVVSALSQSGILNRAMAWSQQLNNTEVGLLTKSGNQLFLTKEGQILLATINKRDAEIKQKTYRIYLDGMKNKKDKFDLAVEMEEYRQKAYDEFGNSDEMKKAIATINGITGIQGLDFFAAEPDITIEGKKIKLGDAYKDGSLVFGGYADTKTQQFLSPDGKLIRPPRPNLPLYFIKIKGKDNKFTYHVKQFEINPEQE